MTAEEFAKEADAAIQPAVEWLVRAAFQAVPHENVEMLVETYMDLMKACAIEAVRGIIAESEKTGHMN